MNTNDKKVQTAPRARQTDDALKRIKHEVNKVARRFRLDAEKRAELESHVRSTVIMALRTSYDPKRAEVGAFAYKVTRNCLNVWMDRETKRRNHFVPMTPEVEERVMNIPAPQPVDEDELARKELVQQTLAALPPVHRRICELYMRYGNLEKVKQVMHKSSRTFYGTLWPCCQEAFKKIFEKSGK